MSIDNLEAWDDTLVGTTKDISFTVPASSPYTYAPIYKHKTTSDVTVCTGSGAGGTCLTREYTGTPAAGQFYINPNSSVLTFNAAQAGVSYYVRFTSLGSYVKVAWHNVLADEIEAIEDALKNGFAHNLVPSTSGTRDLGSSSYKWKDLYLSGSLITGDTIKALHISAITLEADDLIIHDDATIGDTLKALSVSGITMFANDVKVTNTISLQGVPLFHPTMISDASYAFGADYDIVLFDATSNEITTTLPLATESYGKRYTTKKIDGSSNKVIITGTGTDKIDFSTTYELEYNNQFATVVCGGTCWSIIATG